MGSGRTEEEVQELIAMFTSMRMQMQTMSRMMALSGGGQGEAGQGREAAAVGSMVPVDCRRERVPSSDRLQQRGS